MLQIGLEIEGLDLKRRRIKKLPVAIRSLIRDGLEDQIKEARSWMIRNRLSGPPKVIGRRNSSRILARVSGRLINSVKTQVKVGTKTVQARIWLDRRSKAAIYGPVHERGAIIRPKNKRYLTVPLSTEAYGRRARTIPGLFVVRSRRGNLLLVRRRGAGLEPMYKLVGPGEPQEYVKIPKRPFMKPTADQFFPRITRSIAKDLRQALEEV